MNVSGPSTPLPRIPTTAAAPRRPADPAVAAPPEQSDAAPALWDLLTPEERAFFAEQQAHGPLTYRPAGAVRPPEAGVLPLGQRVDARA